MEAVYCSRSRVGQDVNESAVSFNNIMTIAPPATIYSFHPSLISTAVGTYLGRIMIDSLMMAF
jgi:hypothetical protein